MPQPSGWPDFGLGCGHPKSRKFRPVSASCRNARSVSAGTGFRLTTASIRHMSAQLVADLAEERDPLRAVLLRLDALRPLAVDHAEDAATPGRLRHDHLDRVRRRREDRHDLGHVPERAEDVDRVGVLQEDDEEMPGPDASQNATPKRMPGTDPTRASWTSSAVLMKCV